MILIGSKAMSHHIWLNREIGDTDLVGTYEEIEHHIKLTKPVVFYPFNSGRKMYMRYADGAITEADIAWPDSVEERLMNFVLQDHETVLVDNVRIPSLNVLYMLKLSHRYLKNSPHFLKTLRDVQHMRKAGAFIHEAHEEFYEQRMKDTYTYALPKLNVSKESFFDEVATGVVYTFDHDSVHLGMKHLDKPAYQYYSGGAVWSSKDKFFEQTQEVRLYGVLEEAYVLSLERSLVPFPGGKTPKQAFDMALMKLCSSISSGFFRQFAWEAYDVVQALYDERYVDKFHAGVKGGVIKYSH